MVLLVKEDEAEDVVVWYFAGSHNSDADYELYCSSIQRLDKIGSRSRLRVALLVADRSNPVPNAAWRRRIAEVSSNIRPNTLFVLVSERAIVRGIMTAINWMRPPTYKARAVTNFEEAIELVRRERPDAVWKLRDLFYEAKREALELAAD